MIKKELMDLLDELPDIYNNVSLATQKCTEVVDYYKGFVQFVAKRFVMFIRIGEW